MRRLESMELNQNSPNIWKELRNIKIYESFWVILILTLNDFYLYICLSDYFLKYLKYITMSRKHRNICDEKSWRTIIIVKYEVVSPKRAGPRKTFQKMENSKMYQSC